MDLAICIMFILSICFKFGNTNRHMYVLPIFNSKLGIVSSVGASSPHIQMHTRANTCIHAYIHCKHGGSALCHHTFLNTYMPIHTLICIVSTMGLYLF
jgi:hypothetical protein